MQLSTNLPVASLSRVRELGLDEAQFGSCARREKDGKTITLMGCPFERQCEWSDNTTHMHPDDAKDAPRPRMLKYRQSKPRSRGGYSVMESYCACFQWHGDVKQLDGRNGVLVQVVGGEGLKVTVRGTKPVVSGSGKDVAVTNEPNFYKTEIPKFPEPEKRMELMEAIEAGSIMRDAGGEARRQEMARRGLVDGIEDVTTSVSESDVRKAIGKPA